MSKKIITGVECRKKLLSGVKQLAEIVTITLGPKGRNVGLDKKFIEPIVLHDGVSVAREIDLPDPFENFGARLVQQASSKTADRAGDGTTTSTLLAWKIIEEGIKYMDQLDANPMIMKKGIEKAVKNIVKELKKESQKVKTKKEIEQVATVSAASEELGKMIAEAFNRVGKDGVITVEGSESIYTTIEYKEGMEFNKGYVSPYFITNPDKMEAEIIGPHILITDHSITSAQEIVKFLDRFVTEKKREDIVIIADNVDGPALNALLLNKDRGGIKPLAVFAPAFAGRKKEILEDIAILTGGTVISKEKGIKIEEVTPDMLGYAEKVWADAERTKIIGGIGSKEAIKARANQIKDQISKTESEFEKEKLRERLARLVSGAAIIKVGALTEVEFNDRKERVIDAVEATKSALEEGIIAGGGITLFNIYKKNSCTPEGWEKNDELIGEHIVYNSLADPMKKILENAGIDMKKVLKKLMLADNNIGINIETEEEGNMFDMGIIDPTKVTRNAIENAASVAAQILTTQAIVTDIKPDDKKTD